MQINQARRRFLALAALWLGGLLAEAGANEYWTYIGTYTSGKSKGIYRARFDSASGKLSAPELAVSTVNPTFLAVHPNGKFLYAANEIGNFGGKPSGAVTALAMNPQSGSLTVLNQQSSGGGGPCHLAVDASGKHALVANYGGGSIAVLPIREDGRLGEATAFVQHKGSSMNKQRQAGPHAHYITTDPKNRFVLTSDLGLDQVLIYQFDPAQGLIAPHNPPHFTLPPGSGPRHLAFHPDGKTVYVINELDSTLAACAYDADQGILRQTQITRTLPVGFTGNSTTAEVAVHPTGKFVYGSNRGHDSIVVFALESDTGKLKLLQHQPTGGKTPRHFAIDPTGTWLLTENQGSDSVTVFKIDPFSGKLAPAGNAVDVPSPVCLVFAPGDMH